jgi:hypothetical protein
MIIFYAAACKKLFEKEKIVPGFSLNRTHLILKISYPLADIGYGDKFLGVWLFPFLQILFFDTNTI